MNFPDSPVGCATCASWGTFRIPNLKSLHDYVNGRYHDPVYYAPNDHAIFDPLVPCMEQDCEFVSDAECNPGWSSYAMSPAAMFHHDVMRSNAAGGWQAPWTLDHGYQAPGLFQAPYPTSRPSLSRTVGFRARPPSASVNSVHCVSSNAVMPIVTS